MIQPRKEPQGMAKMRAMRRAIGMKAFEVWLDGPAQRALYAWTLPEESISESLSRALLAVTSDTQAVTSDTGKGSIPDAVDVLWRAAMRGDLRLLQSDDARTVMKLREVLSVIMQTETAS